MGVYFREEAKLLKGRHSDDPISELSKTIIPEEN